VTENFEELLADVGNFSIPAGESIILVVDDEHSILSTLERFLKRKGFVVLTAKSTEEALDVLGTDYLPHVVLTDKNLPEADGLELIRRGKDLSPETEFVLMTGYATIESSIEALDLGAAGYLQKPFDLNNVLQKVQVALNKNLALHQHRMLVKRLKYIYEEQANVARERDIMKSFVDGKVGKLLEELNGQIQDVEASVETIEKLGDAIACLDEKAAGAEKAVRDVIDCYKRAAVTLDSFSSAHRGLIAPGD
jgi:DNA-binding NtrC family response regulator